MSEPAELRPGRLVILNGTSSAGKTSIGCALQDSAAEPYVLTGVDHLWTRLPRRYLEDEAAHPDGFQARYAGEGSARRVVGFRVGPTFSRLLRGLHRAAAALAEVGNCVVVDYVVFGDDLLRDAAACWAPLGGVWVGVRPPLAVSERWEAARGDRELGQARAGYASAHAHGRYDLVLDPSEASPEACAAQVLAYLEGGSAPTALSRLAQR